MPQKTPGSGAEPQQPSIRPQILRKSLENWAADGGCQPWRAFESYDGYAGEGKGTCGGGAYGPENLVCTTDGECPESVCEKPYPIVYRPQWPATHKCSGGSQDGYACTSHDDCLGAVEGCLPCN